MSSKTKFGINDGDLAFSGIFGDSINAQKAKAQSVEKEEISETKGNGSSDTEPVSSLNAKESPQQNAEESTRQISVAENDSKACEEAAQPSADKSKGKKREKATVRKQLYITEELDAALRYKIYKDKSRDMSGHIRQALRAYLKEELEELKNS